MDILLIFGGGAGAALCIMLITSDNPLLKLLGVVLEVGCLGVLLWGLIENHRRHTNRK